MTLTEHLDRILRDLGLQLTAAARARMLYSLRASFPDGPRGWELEALDWAAVREICEPRVRRVAMTDVVIMAVERGPSLRMG